MMLKRARRIRLLEYAVTLWVVLTLNFVLPRLMPGDPFLLLSSETDEDVAVFSEEQRQYYLHYYGLDRPLMVQYAAYLANLCRGRLGFSLYYNDDVSTILVKRLRWTGLLVCMATVLSSVVGVFLGSISAWFRETWFDKGLFFGIILFSEIPAFLVGLVLLFVLAAGTGWFPLSGAFTHFVRHESMLAVIADIARHACLPVMALTLARLGGMYLLARNSMTLVLTQDYIKTARAKGAPPRRILFHHGLRNALLPVVSRIFLSLGALVGGAILVENVFAYPGLGLLMRESVMVHDYPLVQGIFLVVTCFVLAANFVADCLYRRLDPRIRES
jgi:peptide/nickel transport system permease protein